MGLGGCDLGGVGHNPFVFPVPAMALVMAWLSARSLKLTLSPVTQSMLPSWLLVGFLGCFLYLVIAHM